MFGEALACSSSAIADWKGFDGATRDLQKALWGTASYSRKTCSAFNCNFHSRKSHQFISSRNMLWQPTNFFKGG